MQQLNRVIIKILSIPKWLLHSDSTCKEKQKQKQTYKLSTQLQVDIRFTFIQNSTIFNDTYEPTTSVYVSYTN